MEFVKLTVTFVDEDDQVISSKDYKYGTKAEDIEVPEAPEKKNSKLQKPMTLRHNKRTAG